SRAMTLKAASAGLDLGGGKAVLIDDGAPAPLRRARIVVLAREIERLDGAYITAEDVGTTTADMDLVAQWTRHVVGRSGAPGGDGDPSPATARTVFDAIGAALEALDGDPGLAGRRVGVVGLGKVGGRLARMLLHAGATVVGCDPLDAAAAPLVDAGMERAPSPAAVLAAGLDVLAPCALGGLIDEQAAAVVRCRVVCGAANNPLDGERAATALARRGILYVPDFMANCGGLVHADLQRRAVDDPAALERALAAARERTRSVLLDARASRRRAADVAVERARARIAAARSAPAGEAVAV
ncbi:MAG: Glu/Leu/Phe/Val dehydrogenase, partial [Solirubrobacterales bacterium]|nr:Glu/Leu/Phe/Val dehydrogenase [Solirubrobacterales bacterium]